MSEENIIATIALTKINGLGTIGIKNLLDHLGDATSVFENRNNLRELIPDINERLIQSLDCPEAFTQAEDELKFIQKGQINCLCIQDKDYPRRLKECADAPAILFYKGNTDLNKPKVVSMIGTRNATEYGKENCYKFIRDLKEIYPEILIVSGLAYGIDIHAHRAALEAGMNTVGVLAHGLDRIYPYTHRKTAIEMISQGGLLTEYLSGTNPDRHNFVQRNRIVAGMCDATIVVESASKGGALITANLANDYNRECFAYPGRSSDEYSKGCNLLIRENKATLIQSAEDFVSSMGWKDNPPKANQPIQQTLFIDLSPEEENIINLLSKEGDQQINNIVVRTNIPVQKVNALLFELEMKGIIRPLAGGIYHLIN